MHFRRRREGKTDYKYRLRLLLSGKPRLVVRLSLRYVQAQLVEYGAEGDRVLAAVLSKELRRLDWQYACDNTPAAYLTGLLLGKRAVQLGIKEAVLDMGLCTSTKGARVYAVVRGVRDAGLHVPCNESMFPSEQRIRGEHIAAHLPRFKDLPQTFERIKECILKAS